MASASSSSPRPKRYDVFLSFLGKDTRRTIVSHLGRALALRGIVIFKDDMVPKDQPIDEAVGEAIRNSRIAVVVLSENYASSRWCLNELHLIMELQRKKELIVIPIFYEVDPSDMRHQTGSFAIAFEEYHKESRPEIPKWREALTQIANLQGMISTQWQTEADMLEKLAEDISDMLLDSLPTNLPTNWISLVGMDRQMKAIYELLDLESNKEVCMIGIWGMAGVGKTTLARYVCEKISHDFDVHVFLENLKKIDQNHGLSRSVEKFLYRNIRGEAPRTGSPNMGSDVMKPRLRHRKVLLIADGVEETNELQDVADEASQFGPGSRVIVVTREKSLLAACGITHVYELECLRYDEALQLFCQFAFKQEYPPSSFEQLSYRAVHLASCLPLALKILGSFVCDKNENYWESAFQRLEESLGEGIIGVPRRSYRKADEQNYYSSFILSLK